MPPLTPTLVRPLLSAHKRRLFSAVLTTTSITSITSMPDLRLPSNLHGFQLLKTAAFPHLHLQAALLRHEHSGALLYHFDRDDPVRAFLVAFRTPPTDSSGVQHILEHTALCGSAKYPVRDPFFKMLTRSFATFMNAMTATDYTMYPFATLNARDYTNLLRVYLDAVFRPNLYAHDFAQEGWRLEHADPRAPDTTPLELKGVVYSEMKGVMSDTSSLFQYALMKEIYRGSVLAHVSGGEPLEIPALSHADLVNFHRTHYTPQAARFFTYGRAEQVLTDALPEIASVLSSSSSSSLSSPTAAARSSQRDADAVFDFDREFATAQAPANAQGKNDDDDYIRVSCAPDPAGDPERQTRMCVSFLTNDSADTYTTFAMSVLSDLLMAGASSPLHRALIASGLATQYAPGSGYDHSVRGCTLTVGAQGLRADDVARAETAIMDVLRACARTGFETDKIAAVLHGVELRLRKMTPKFGVNLLMAAANSAVNGVNAFEAMDAVGQISRLRAEGPGIFTRLLNDLVLGAGCRRRVKLMMVPSNEYTATLARRERELLEAKVAQLTAQDKEAVKRLGRDLVARQEAPQDASVLPCLALSDIEKRAAAFPLLRDSKVPLFSRASATNGIVYLGAISVLPRASLDGECNDLLCAALPLFAQAMSWQGTKSKTMEELDVEIRSNTGGISFHPSAIRNVAGRDSCQIAINMSGLALEEKVENLGRLVLELVHGTNFENEERLRVLISMMTSNMMDSIAYSGHQFALSLASSLVNSTSKINETWDGLSQLRYLTQLGKDDEKVKQLVRNLLKLRDLFIKSSVTRTHLVSTEAKMAQVKSYISSKFIPEYPHAGGDVKETSTDSAVASSTETKATGSLKQVFVPAPYQVGYAACAVRTDAGYLHPDSAALQVAAQLLSQLYMHREVREKGGAYGGGASFDSVSGLFKMYSYRDPRVVETRKAMDAGIKWLSGDSSASSPTAASVPPPQPSAQELLEAKLKIFAAIDQPLAPGSEGWVEFEQGLTLEMRQARRERLFAVTADDVKRVAKKYLSQDTRIDVAYAIIGPENLEEAFAKDGWKIQKSDK